MYFRSAQYVFSSNKKCSFQILFDGRPYSGKVRALGAAILTGLKVLAISRMRRLAAF